MPKPGKAQLYIGKFEDENNIRLRGEDNYVIRVEKDVPAKLFWSIVVYDADTRCIIDNQKGAAEGKAMGGSKTKGIRKNADGSYYVLLGPDAPPNGWEANHFRPCPDEAGSPTCACTGLKNRPSTTRTSSRPSTRSRTSQNTSNRKIEAGAVRECFF